jgi:hypothetical protein
MTLRKFLILRRPPLRDAACGGSSGQGGRLEGGTTLIQAVVDFLTASKAGIYVRIGHRPEPVLGSAKGRTRGLE